MAPSMSTCETVAGDDPAAASETPWEPAWDGAQRIGGRLFGLLYGSSLVYNQCWEDPAIDREALALGPSDRVVVLTSAGCNALDYALLGARVLAVDANPRQNHLLELKLAGLRALGHDDFFALFGAGGTPRARALYARLCPHLSREARAYWDRAIVTFDPRRTRGGSFYYSGTAGLFALMARLYIDLSGLRADMDRLLAAASIDEQLRLYRDHIRHRLGDRVLRVVGGSAVMALLGVPEPQRRLVHSHPGGVVGYLRGCLDHVLSVALLRENYFWAVYLNGRYQRDACPSYLQSTGFERLRLGLADNVRAVTATLSGALRRTRETFSAFVLLDHMDWLVQHPALIEEEWRLIFDRAARGARVIFRSGSPEASFLPPWVRARLDFDEARARALHARDRVGTYGSFHIARVLD
jgi:S-adenosylmethionine-diacylglycerol 3-amino-3-carboxypropyl transferase